MRAWVLAALLLIAGTVLLGQGPMFPGPGAPTAPPAITTLYSLAPGASNPGNNNYAIVTQVQLSGNAKNQVRVTVAPGSDITGQFANVYICIASGAQNCSGPPVQLFFSGAATSPVMAAGTTLASDFSNFAAPGINFAVCYEIPPASSAGGVSSVGAQPTITYYVGNGKCANGTWSGWQTLPNTNSGVAKVETK